MISGPSHQNACSFEGGPCLALLGPEGSLCWEQVWVVEDGELRDYPGDFEDYRNELVKEIAAELDEE